MAVAKTLMQIFWTLRCPVGNILIILLQEQNYHPWNVSKTNAAYYAVRCSVVTKMAWNKLETDFGSTNQPHMFAKITGIENRHVFLPHSWFGLQDTHTHTHTHTNTHTKQNIRAEKNEGCCLHLFLMNSFVLVYSMSYKLMVQQYAHINIALRYIWVWWNQLWADYLVCS
jgi:hypothetical protein